MSPRWIWTLNLCVFSLLPFSFYLCMYFCLFIQKLTWRNNRPDQCQHLCLSIPLVCKRKNNRNHLASDRSCFARKKSTMSCTRHCDASSTNEKRDDLLMEFISNRSSSPTSRRENNFSSFLAHFSWLQVAYTWAKEIDHCIHRWGSTRERETSLWSSLITFCCVTSQWMSLDTCSLPKSLKWNESWPDASSFSSPSWRIISSDWTLRDGYQCLGR